MARRALAVAAVLLLAVSAAAFMTDDEKEGLSWGCPDDTTNGWSVDDCTACIDVVGDTLGSNKSFACLTLCAELVDTTNCQFCLATDGTTYHGCAGCLALPAAQQLACIASLTAGPDASLPWWRTQSYQDAVPKCYEICDDDCDELFDCLACLSDTDSADLETLDEQAARMRDGKPAPDVDFGKCVWYYNNSWNMANDPENAEGAATLCTANPSAYFGASDCISCMLDANEWLVYNSSNPSQPLYGKSLAFGCSAYCQDDRINLGDSENAAWCSDCLATEGVTDAWACGECTRLGAGSGQEECLTCISSNWYGGKADNLNWACAECGSIEEGSLRDACFSCITSQPGALDAAEFDYNVTIPNICECVSQTKVGQTARDTIAIDLDFALDARYRSCYYTWNETSTIPWGAPEGISSPSGSPCIQCMMDADAAAYEQDAVSVAWACHDYCQDPNIVSGSRAEEEGDQCRNCILGNIVDGSHARPEGCKACMSVTQIIEDDNERFVRRAECMGCVGNEAYVDTFITGVHYDEQVAACSACAGLSNDGARCSCYNCIAQWLGLEVQGIAHTTSAWECVTAAKNGTLPECIFA